MFSDINDVVDFLLSNNFSFYNPRKECDFSNLSIGHVLFYGNKKVSLNDEQYNLFQKGWYLYIDKFFGDSMKEFRETIRKIIKSHSHKLTSFRSNFNDLSSDKEIVIRFVEDFSNEERESDREQKKQLVLSECLKYSKKMGYDSYIKMENE